MTSIHAELIETPRLGLMPLRPEHAGEMAAVLAEEDLYFFTGGNPPRADEVRARYERWSAGSPEPAVVWLNWVISLRAEQRLVGTVQATISAAGTGNAAEVAWIVGRPWQGRGIATEAARALVGPPGTLPADEAEMSRRASPALSAAGVSLRSGV